MKKKILIITLIVVIVGLITAVCIYGINKHNKNLDNQKEQEKIRNAIVSTLTIDVNPSIEINLNKDNVVVSVKSLNEDSIKLLENKDFKGETIENAMTTIIDSLKENNYLSEETNTILINVKSEDEKLSNLIQDSVEKITQEKEIVTEVVMLSVEETDELKELAEQNNITIAKAYYIQEQIKDEEGLTFEELKDVSVNEIKTKLEDKKQEKIKKEQEEKAKEEAETAKNQSNNSNTSGNNNSSGKSSSCNPPSALKSSEWCNFNTKRPQWCNFSYPQKANSYNVSQSLYSHLGISPFDTIGSYGTEVLKEGASYCYAYKNIITTRQYRYTFLQDSVTGEILEESKENVPSFIDENTIKQNALNRFSLKEEDCVRVEINLHTEMEGSPNWYYRYSVAMQLSDGTLHSAWYNAVTGSLVKSQTTNINN